MSVFLSLKKFKRKKIKKLFSKKDLEPQEVFLDKLAKKKEKKLGISEKKFEVPLSQKALFRFLFFVIIIIIILFVKTFQFQVLENKRFLAQAEENKFIIHLIRAERGVIYDKNGKQLVFNRPSFDLVVDKSKLPSSDKERERVLKEVADIIEQNYDDLKDKIFKQEINLVPISRNLTHQKVILLETRIHDLTGFEIKKSSFREYKDGLSFAHLIGYTGKITIEELKENPKIYSSFDYLGRNGLEKSYEEVLRKNPGRLKIKRDALGRHLSKETISLPESGKSLVLYLDSDLQIKIEQELQNTLSKIGAKKAVGIALNPQNGGVLSLVSLPSFDNNLFSKGSDPEALSALLKDKEEPLFNRVISGQYAVGSTIKPLIAAAALEEKIISPDKLIDDNLGYIEIPHKYNPEIKYIFRDWRPHGWVDLRKAIAQSCNVYFYTVGGGYKNQKGLGPTKIKKYLELFGWTDKTGIDLPNESRGFVPSPDWKKKMKEENWWDGDTYNLSIGQGDIMITPLEVASSFVAIANGGTLYKPKVVKEIVDSEKKVVEEIKPEILRKDFIDPNNLKIVREGMRKAVTGYNAPYASAVLLNSLPVSAAAKTGTAQTPIANHYHNWVTVFAPYENPEIVLTIMIENVPRIQAAVLPVAKNVLEWYFKKT